MKISIVVPVYNIERYVSKCIDSIINQSYKNIELILVDDGSCDSSGNILDGYKDERIKVIHQKNMGLSEARNSGIKVSTGDYIMFVDGDDFLIDNSLTKLVEKIKDNDLLEYKMQYFYEDKQVTLSDYPNIDNLDLKSKLKKLIETGTFIPSACNKLIKSEIIKKNNLFFEKGLLSEDIKWTLNLYFYINKFDVLNEEIYGYRQQRKESITNTISKKNILSLFSIIEYFVNYNYKDNQTKDIYLSYMAYQYLILITIMNNKNSTKDDRKKIYSYKYLLNYNLNFKVKLANKIIRILGMNFGIRILKIYNYLKNKGILKI